MHIKVDFVGHLKEMSIVKENGVRRHTSLYLSNFGVSFTSIQDFLVFFFSDLKHHNYNTLRTFMLSDIALYCKKHFTAKPKAL